MEDSKKWSCSCCHVRRVKTTDAATEIRVDAASPRLEGVHDATMPLAPPQAALTPEEKTQELERLKSLVKQFVKDAIEGLPVSSVDPHTYTATNAVMQIDKSLTSIIVTPTVVAKDTIPPVEYRISDFHAISRGQNVVKKLADYPVSWLGNTLFIEFKTSPDGTRSPPAVFLVRDADELNRFYQALAMIRLIERNRAVASASPR